MIRSGSAAAAASPRRGGNWNRLQILVVMTWKPAGSARIAGEPNIVSACRMAISVPASMAGSTSGMVTLRSVVIALAAEDGRRVLEIGRHLVERVGDQREDIGEGEAGDGEDEAGERVDVDQILADARARRRCR